MGDQTEMKLKTKTTIQMWNPWNPQQCSTTFLHHGNSVKKALPKTHPRTLFSISILLNEKGRIWKKIKQFKTEMWPANIILSVRDTGKGVETRLD